MDAKTASFEIANAISKVKKIKVSNKDFLTIVEKNIDFDIKAIQRKDFVGAANSVIKLVAVTDSYIKTGNLDKPITEAPIATVAPITNLIKKEDVNSKLHLDKNNNYLFFITNGSMTLEKGDTTLNNIEASAEDFSVNLEDGKKYNLGLLTMVSTDVENINVEMFKTNNELKEQFKTSVAGSLEASLGGGQIIKSEISENYNFKALNIHIHF